MRRFPRSLSIALSPRYLLVLLLFTIGCGGRTSSEASRDEKPGPPTGDAPAAHADSGDGTEPVDDGGKAMGDAGGKPVDGGVGRGDGGADAGRITGYPDGEGPVWEEGARACHSHPYDLHPCPDNQWCYPGRVPSCAALGACVDRPNPALCLDDCPGVCGLLPSLVERFYCNDCLANADGACVVNDGPCS